jgi:hypothetical protein
MPIQPVKIPQNVYIEDRIVGPLTLRQIIIVAIGGGFSYLLWSSLAKAYGSVSLPLTVMVWLPGVVSAAFAFVKVNDLSMAKLCLLLFERMNKPPRRTWAPRRGITINIRTIPPSHTKATVASQPEPSDHRLEELSGILDARNGKSIDIVAPEEQEEVLPHRVLPESTSDPQPRSTIFRDIHPPSAA